MPTTVDIAEIRRSIVRSDKVFSGYPVQFNKEIVESINCYAYSMGIIYHGDVGIDFYPGFAVGREFGVQKENELIQNVIADLKKLRIKHRYIPLDGELNLKANEYLVKAYILPPIEYAKKGDFHFIRQDKKTGKWFHKMGWYDQPDFVVRAKGKMAPKTIEVSILDEIYSYCEVCYFAITERK